MINSFMEEIKKHLQMENKYVSNYIVDRCLVSLLVLKYYCDNSIYSYKDIIHGQELNDILFPIDDMKINIRSLECPKLLAYIQYEDLETLIKEYINRREFEIDFINNQETKICITSNLEKELYDYQGNTIYVTDRLDVLSYEVAVFKFFDKVLGVNNQYLTYDEAIKKEFKYVYLHENIPKYRFIRNSSNDVYNIIRRILYLNQAQVILHTSFKKVSNMKDIRSLVNSLKKVILYDEKNTFLYFEESDNKQVSIINYNKEKVKSLEQLYKIIDTDRKQKDVLVKTTQEEIINNYYRIGFRLYQNEKIDDVKNINEIVDENTKLIEKLSRINQDIEQEINNLINR